MISVTQEKYTSKEKEYILFFESKKKYFLSINNKNIASFTEADSETVDKMSVTDSSFLIYLNKQIHEPLLFTLQEKCSRLIDSSTIKRKFKELKKAREDAFLSYFKKEGVE